MRNTLWAALCLLTITVAAPAFGVTCSAQQTASYLSAGTDYVLTPKEVDYVIVVDQSGSMQGVKLETVKRAVTSLVGQLPPNERAAIIAFNYNATLQQGLTSNHAELIQSLSKLKAEYGTQYAPPLELAANEFRNARSDRALIFLSDGKSDFGEAPEQILTIAQDLVGRNVCIFTVSYALGGDESELLRAMAELSQTRGCGDHFIASEKGNELEQVFSTIHDTLSASELITITPEMLGNSSYAFRYQSKLNSLPVPGIKGTACAEQPALNLTFTRNGRVVTSVGPDANGSFHLPTGTYDYKASAQLRCGGQCSYSGVSVGNLSVTGTCNPSYTDLATYVTGETQFVSITQNGFTPSVVSGRQGTVVAWTNNDTVPRRVRSQEFDEILQPQTTFSYVIGGVGTLVYSDPDRNFTGSVAPIKGSGTDVLLIIDESGSMKGAGISEAQAAAKQFFTLLTSVDRGALLTFSQDANVLQEFTSDRSLLLDAASRIVSKGPTNYLSALQQAEQLRLQQKGVLVFMSDGVPTDPEGEDAILEQVERLRANGWCIMTVGFGEEGAQAKQLLARMAGSDQCSAFLYASSGSLTKTFGTIYQLSHAQNDLLFPHMHVPVIRFQKSLTLTTDVVTKTGKPVPGGYDLCSPPASVQMRTTTGSVDAQYAAGTYTATVDSGKLVDHVQIIAAVVSPDQPGRTFVGATTRTVVYIPALPLAALITIGLVGTLIYFRLWRRGL